MTNKEILHTDLLDILFEHRNKAYGAYALRRTYNRRLMTSLGITMCVFLLFLFLRNIVEGKNDGQRPGDSGPFVQVSAVVLPDEPEKEKEPKPKEKEQFKQVKSTDNIQIVPDTEKTQMPDQTTIAESVIGTMDIDGQIPTDPNMVIKPSGDEGKGKKEDNDTEPRAEKGETVLPSFPGGNDAMANFLRHHLQTPADLEPGQKVTVLIKFLVSTDGSISGYEMVQSGGKAYDKEVIRVIKKMPRWNPGKQNGHLISMYFTQPITFMGVEE